MPSYELFGGPCHWDLQLHFQGAIDRGMEGSKDVEDGKWR